MRKHFLPGPGEPGLVSIIIPTYQRADLVGEAIDSVLAQTYSRFEAIVVDDGSTDNTREVVARYDDPRVKYVYQSNGGLSSARNLGLEHANGEFVAFLDSDDIWAPFKLEAQIEVFARHPEVGLCWSDMSSFVTSGVVLQERHLRTYYTAYRHCEVTEVCEQAGKLSDLTSQAPDSIASDGYYVGNVFREMFFGNLVHPPTAIVRRSRLQKSGGFEPEVTGPGAEDYHFYLRVTEQGPVAFIDAPLIHYRVHATQMSTSNALLESHADLRLVRHWLPRVNGIVPQRFMRKRLARAHAWVGYEELAAGNSRTAAANLWRSLVLRSQQPRTAMFLVMSVMPHPVRAFARAAKRQFSRVAASALLLQVGITVLKRLSLLYVLIAIFQPDIAEP